jgi:hypothetical protein
VPGHASAPEHEWKNGDPWFSARCEKVDSKIINGVATGQGSTKFQPTTLTAIMEGKANVRGFLRGLG